MGCCLPLLACLNNHVILTFCHVVAVFLIPVALASLFVASPVVLPVFNCLFVVSSCLLSLLLFYCKTRDTTHLQNAGQTRQQSRRLITTRQQDRRGCHYVAWNPEKGPRTFGRRAFAFEVAKSNSSISVLLTSQAHCPNAKLSRLEF